jgi:hypothetical protein
MAMAETIEGRYFFEDFELDRNKRLILKKAHLFH